MKKAILVLLGIAIFAYLIKTILNTSTNFDTEEDMVEEDRTDNQF
ncbi:MAG TPA: hypothetical protein VK115_01585 [Staphylococcus sp.]|nr:hypothetical protein [Staphylococcus sp.]